MRPEAVDFGLNSGTEAAEMAAERYGREPMRMAAAIRIAVLRSDDSPQAGSMVHFSEYREKPPQVTLHRRSMAEANQLIQEHDLEGLLGLADVEPIHLAHELYHHLETKKLIPGASRFRLETFRLGPIRFRTGLPSLSEIAADGFALSTGYLYQGELLIDKTDLSKTTFVSEFTKERLPIDHTRFATDQRVIDPHCDCTTCNHGYSRAYLHHLYRCRELTYYRLASIHNVPFMIRVAEQLRKAILAE